MATYLKTFQALSYERLQALMSDLFGLTLSQGGLMNLLRRAQGRFRPGREAAVATLRQAEVVASDETGVRIEGCNAYHWVFHSAQTVVHTASPTRGAVVVREMMDGHRPAVWIDEAVEPARGVAFEGVGDDGGQQLIPHQQLAVTGDAQKFVPDRCAKDPIPIHGAGAHAVLGLLGVLLDDMLGKAHTLPDGRRAFKTADGQDVYDEHGQKLDRETIDPAGIDDRQPKWETFRDGKQEWNRLNGERQGLLDYQAKLDEARDRLDKGDVTARQLDDMERDLHNAMPDAVRAKIEPEKPKAEAAPVVTATPSMPDGMDALMRQTGLGPSSRQVRDERDARLVLNRRGNPARAAVQVRPSAPDGFGT